MDNVFTIKRVQTKLSLFKFRSEKLAESDDLTISDVKELMKDIEEERELTLDNMNSIIQETNYVPALDEAIKFITTGLSEGDMIDCANSLQDSAFSLGYYIAH
jgi:hypothetical protein